MDVGDDDHYHEDGEDDHYHEDGDDDDDCVDDDDDDYSDDDGNDHDNNDDDHDYGVDDDDAYDDNGDMTMMIVMMTRRITITSHHRYRSETMRYLWVKPASSVKAVM